MDFKSSLLKQLRNRNAREAPLGSILNEVSKMTVQLAKEKMEKGKLQRQLMSSNLGATGATHGNILLFQGIAPHLVTKLHALAEAKLQDTSLDPAFIKGLECVLEQHLKPKESHNHIHDETAFFTIDDAVITFSDCVIKQLINENESDKVPLHKIEKLVRDFREFFMDVTYGACTSPQGEAEKQLSLDDEADYAVLQLVRCKVASEFLELHEKLYRTEIELAIKHGDIVECYHKVAAANKDSFVLRQQLLRARTGMQEQQREERRLQSLLAAVRDENSILLKLTKDQGQSIAEMKNLQQQNEKLHNDNMIVNNSMEDLASKLKSALQDLERLTLDNVTLKNDVAEAEKREREAKQQLDQSKECYHQVLAMQAHTIEVLHQRLGIHEEHEDSSVPEPLRTNSDSAFGTLENLQRQATNEISKYVEPVLTTPVEDSTTIEANANANDGADGVTDPVPPTLDQNSSVLYANMNNPLHVQNQFTPFLSAQEQEEYYRLTKSAQEQSSVYNNSNNNNNNLASQSGYPAAYYVVQPNAPPPQYHTYYSYYPT